MSVIAEVRREREDLARVLKKHTGIRKLVEELYPDSAHFIYELLQNAEDATNEQGKGATEASFILSKTCLVFEHNGQAFDKGDIEAITDIGGGTKADDVNKIGRFGIGFKAVFAYTETPHIWSPTFSFKIDDLVLPSVLDPKSELGNKTRFEFPFNNPKKTPKDAYADVEAGLSELAEKTLLFLTHLESIRWKIGQRISGEILRIKHSENHFEVLKQINGKTTTSSHFLKFDQPVPGLKKQRVSVAYALDLLPNVQSFDSNKPLAKQLKIAPAAPGHVAVFFLAEKETSGLRFHLHAPFVPELSRASIKETPANEPLFQQLATLSAASLHDIRDLGLLTVDFLSVLPNPQDTLPPRYERIRSAIVEAMNTESLTPTQSKSHAPAAHLLQAKASLKSLLSKDDLEFLVEDFEELPQWAIGATQKNNSVDRFLNGLEITEWGVDEFIEAINSKSDEYDDELNDLVDNLTPWLKNKTVDWHQQLYALLNSELESSELFKVKNSKIIRLTDGDYSVGSKCFFPGNAFEENEVLPRIEIGVFTSGKSKSQKENSRTFLVSIGVRNVGEPELVEAILKQRYAKESKVPDKEIYRKDLKRFIALVEAEPSAAKLFAWHYIFERIDGKWSTPSGIFLDKPFLDTGLTAYFEALGECSERSKLAESYQDCGVSAKRVSKFAKEVGAKVQLQVQERRVHNHPESSALKADWHRAYVRRTHTEIDEDFYIPSLKKVLKPPSIGISKLLWDTIKNASQRVFVARYRPNQQYMTRSAPSTLCLALKEAAWVPQGEGKFVRPAKASRDLLPPGFSFDPGWSWLKSIQFGEALIKVSEENRQRQTAVKEMGFSDEKALKDGQWFANLSPEQRQEYQLDYERKKTELPEHEPTNPTQRSERVGALAAEAPDRRTEERTRSVSVGREAVKEEASQYLRQQYTNANGEMICQVCKETLPFKLDDGSYFFETVEFLSDLKNRHFQNYLTLCPNHSAMFRHVNDSRELLAEMFDDLTENKLEIILAQNDAEIYFTRTHIGDLRAVIESDAQRLQDNEDQADPSDDVSGE